MAYSKPGVTDEQVRQACQAVGIDHFIQTPARWVRHRAQRQGQPVRRQKQLLTIARAMVENAPLLILDEATSSVDTRTEVLISRPWTG